MTPNRWKMPALACLLASPLFGCATVGSVSGPAATSIRTSAMRPASDRQLRWTDFQQVLERRIASPAFEQLVLDQPRVDPSHVERQIAADAATDLPGQQVFDDRVLAAQNQERQGLGLVPLRWNPALAHAAKHWADYLASTGRFEHAPENRSAPEGENLWAGTKGYYTPEAMVDAWIREKKFFRPGTFPDNSITGRVEDVGHYTQLVWRATTQVGCAQARSRSEDILVCRYAEAGNYRGEVPF
jgi:uncharacterized protein YkwD